MPYDPHDPASIFEGENLVQFALGLNNAYAIKLGLSSADKTCPDARICLAALKDANAELEVL